MFKKMFGNKNEIVMNSPINGKVIELSEVPDQVFSQKMVGDGFAIIPTDGEVLSPFDGKIVQIFPTKHAIGLLTTSGLEILIHFGLDTVELKGEGFIKFIEANQEVKVGDKLISVDLEVLKKNKKSCITPIIFTNKSQYKSLNINYGNIKSGDVCATIKLVKR